jgi:hypothetical protein
MTKQSTLSTSDEIRYRRDNTKYTHGQEISIAKGYYKGKKGKILSYKIMTTLQETINPYSNQVEKIPKNDTWYYTEIQLSKEDSKNEWLHEQDITIKKKWMIF